MMPRALDFWLETVGVLAVILLLPFYIGMRGLTVIELLAYVAVAGAVLTGGDHLRFASVRPVGISELAMDFALWAQAVLGLGLIAYLLALLIA